ncbi:AraC family transcriptional regulator [Bacillus sp. WP8]|uniref:AraC family transcriptional regulator n=1 Tax=Bacillus sp. WP8 TaxID=756828 RepID=UPI0011A31554|nr:AraC family transcriptional regulator [Bacillus sp. WP8]
MILEYMGEDYEKKVRRKELADKMGFDESYFWRFLKESMGVSVSEYIGEIGIDEGKKGVVERDDQIEMIGGEVGYRESLYLRRKLREKRGRWGSELGKNGRGEGIGGFEFVGLLGGVGIGGVWIVQDTFQD